MKARLAAIGLIVLGLALGYFIYPFAGIWGSLNIPFRLGLDLKGGVGLIYRADVSNIPIDERARALEGLRDVIERRINFFGVSEPIVRVEQVGGEDRLVARLAGVFDIEKAIEVIGETPFLEFQLERAAQPVEEGTSSIPEVPQFEPTGLDGRYLKSAALEFSGTASQPTVRIVFNDEGSKIFEELTEKNVGKRIAIFLDGVPISIPMVQEKISGGTASITGDFTPEEARLLAQRLNSGALPVPIELISQETVEPDRGQESLTKSFFAGIVGLAAVVLFMLLWYRLPGLFAVLALGIYIALTLTLFKIIPVTFSTAGIAGFILSVGMAVDANILIFERLKEELRLGKPLSTAIEEGFARAWTSIRDSNVSSLLTALILWYFGTDAVRGFALTLGIGVAVSMFSAIVVTRTFLRAFHKRGGVAGFAYSVGFRIKP